MIQEIFRFKVTTNYKSFWINLRKFDEYEKDSEEKEKIINSSIQYDFICLKERIDVLKKKSDDSKQYSRINCLLVHGVKKQDQENTDNIVLNVLKKHLDIE